LEYRLVTRSNTSREAATLLPIYIPDKGFPGFIQKDRPTFAAARQGATAA
jgi:hypothetical protein